MTSQSKLDEFIKISRKVDYSQFLPPTLSLVSNEEAWASESDKAYFQVQKFKYPKNPVDLMIKVMDDDRSKLLCVEGTGANCWSKKYLPLSRSEVFAIQKEWMFHPHTIAQFCDAYGWLKCVKKIKSFGSFSSYGLKHSVENFSRYVGNGAFIAAAIALNFNMKVDSLNPIIAISKKSVNASNKYVDFLESNVPGSSYYIYKRNYNHVLGEYLFWWSDERLPNRQSSFAAS